ncbi:MAG: hypothetical protein BJ554DRAFT_1459 [Olpidium bornovanus]|uniref:Uncharacterized protein n=1 Tax=Olpidium bornovanus TaxID=278681 RepID=A0A8H8A0Z7_9FUNG|nr:MAG: hypothetical protein BJ554DRAFT_1459 [Olpidium bornovanus]
MMRQPPSFPPTSHACGGRHQTPDESSTMMTDDDPAHAVTRTTAALVAGHGPPPRPGCPPLPPPHPPLPPSSAAATVAADWLLWVLADSGLPTGGFVASAGLEAAVQLGHVRDLAGVGAFVRASVHACASGALPFVAAAHRRASSLTSSEDGFGRPAAAAVEEAVRHLVEVDDLYDASNPNSPLRRASRAQGVALLTVYDRCVAAGVRGPEGVGADDARTTTVRLLKQWRARPRVLRAGLRGDGYLNRYQWDCAFSQRGFFEKAYQPNRYALGVPGVGPYAAQRLLVSFHDFTDAVVARAERQFAAILSAGTTAETLHLLAEISAQTAPLVDIWQGVHDRLLELGCGLHSKASEFTGYRLAVVAEDGTAIHFPVPVPWEEANCAANLLASIAAFAAPSATALARCASLESSMGALDGIGAGAGRLDPVNVDDRSPAFRNFIVRALLADSGVAFEDVAVAVEGPRHPLCPSPAR